MTAQKNNVEAKEAKKSVLLWGGFDHSNAYELSENWTGNTFSKQSL